MQKHQPEGFVLILVLLVTSILIILGTQLYYRSTTNTLFSASLLKRERAKVLALSGIELAKSFFIFDDASENKSKEALDKKDESKGASESAYYKKLFAKLFPYINVWQEFKLDNENSIKFCICCEDGKININQFYDFNAGKFKSNDDEVFFKKIFENLESKSDSKIKYSEFVNFLKSRKYPLNDVTDILKAKDFDFFKDNIFLKNDSQNGIILTDLFTVFSSKKEIQPIFLSRTVLGLLGIKFSEKDPKSFIKIATESAKELKQKINWPSDWSRLLEQKYSKSYASIPKEYSKLFDSDFAPKNFSVISLGIVDGVEQKVYAILHFDKIQDKVILTLKRLYWI